MDALSIRRTALGALLSWGLGATAAAEPPAGAIPPLDDQTRAALAAASDGLDRRDEAWHRLLEHARSWPADPAARRAALEASPLVRRPAWGEWMLEPDPHRGALVTLRGRVEQETEFDWPATRGGDSPPRLAEWFIRLETRPGDTQSPPTVQCWVVDPPPASGRGPREVEVAARFLRITEERARDGVSRRWHTFVGMAMVPPDAAAAAGSSKWLLPTLVVALLPPLFWLRRLARGGRRGATLPRPAPKDDANPPPRSDLPPDPAEALAVLRREAEPAAAGESP